LGYKRSSAWASNFTSDDEVKERVDDWLAQAALDFFYRGICTFFFLSVGSR
jgi:hypothetical protein